MIAIIYHSKYGSTRQYAEWLQERLGADIYPLSKFKKQDFARYEVIIFGSYLYGNHLAKLNFIQKNEALLQGKTLILFAVGFSLPDEKFIGYLKKINGIDKDVPLFYMRGKVDIAKLKTMDRAVIKLITRTIAAKPPEELSVQDRELLSATIYATDYTTEKALMPIEDYIKSL